MNLETIHKKILELRGHKVMLDFDLAQLYEVETKNLNLAVKRNHKRFPEDFMFRLNEEEWGKLELKNESENRDDSLRLQIATLKKGRGQHRKYLPYAFTEQGVSMLSSVLKSDKAIDVNIGIMRAFVLIRNFALTNKDLTEKLRELETKFNKQFKDVYYAMNYLLNKDKLEKDQHERTRIGYV